MSFPRVTVLMPVYNAEKYLSEAIDSILQQTFTDFELLIINDGSTDGSLRIIKSYNNKRIRLVENETNIRLIATLNKGIELSQGEYIARFDADDVCLPQRLEKQVVFMDAQPEVGLCGSFLRTLGLENNYEIQFATGHDQIKFKLFFDTHFPHPAAMIRRSVLMKHHLRFEKEYIHVEDREMWSRMAEVCKLAIIPEVLVLKRSHEGQISAMHTETQDKISRKISEELIEKLGVKTSMPEMNVYEDFLKGNFPAGKNDLELLLDFFEKLVIGNNSAKAYRKDLFSRFFAEKYWQLCTRSTHLGITIFRKYRKSIFHKENSYSNKNSLRFLLKALVRYSYR